MADLLPKEALQPSLLDRLTDYEPEDKQESRANRVLSMSKLKECVRRDLVWLLNSSNLNSVIKFDEYPDAAKSVVNYGMPDLAGHTASDIDVISLEKRIKEVIQTYEPRILADTLKIDVSVEDSLMNHNTMTMEIAGEMWAIPIPIHLLIKTQVDLETGSVSLINFASDG
jgi:type VI secretion system protein ImpF